MKLRRWVVIAPNGQEVSRHWFYRTAFYEARGRSLREPAPELRWWVRRAV